MGDLRIAEARLKRLASVRRRRERKAIFEVVGRGEQDAITLGERPQVRDRRPWQEAAPAVGRAVADCVPVGGKDADQKRSVAPLQKGRQRAVDRQGHLPREPAIAGDQQPISARGALAQVDRVRRTRVDRQDSQVPGAHAAGESERPPLGATVVRHDHRGEVVAVGHRQIDHLRRRRGRLDAKELLVALRLKHGLRNGRRAVRRRDDHLRNPHRLRSTYPDGPDFSRCHR